MRPRRASATPIPAAAELEGSERSRTLLFLGVALLIARVCSASRVLINENGIMAIHVPIAEARIGSYSTRTAAPSIMRRIEALGDAALGGHVEVDNMLLRQTKAEVVHFPGQLGLTADLLQTVSCWSITRRGTHCGWCVPCIVRRIAFESIGTPDVQYDNDVFNIDETAPDWAVDNITHYLGFIGDLVTLDDIHLEMSVAKSSKTRQQCRLQIAWLFIGAGENRRPLYWPDIQG